MDIDNLERRSGTEFGGFDRGVAATVLSCGHALIGVAKFTLGLAVSRGDSANVAPTRCEVLERRAGATMLAVVESRACETEATSDA